MKDTLGNTINIGDVICHSGGGNKKCEYGLITGIVTKISDGKVFFNRLSVTYENKNPIIKLKSSYKTSGKFVKVNFCPALILSWLNGVWINSEKDQIALWVHQGVFIK